MTGKIYKNYFIGGILFFALSFYAYANANEIAEPVIVDGDKVELISGENKVKAEGNIVIIHKGSKLTCDEVTVDTVTKDAHAIGNVRLESDNGVILAEEMRYNLDTKRGVMFKAHILFPPYYGRSDFVEKISDNEIKMYKGYFTSCDRQKPHYRLRAKRIDFSLGEKVRANDLTFMLYNSTLAYMPKYVHPLNDSRPRVTVVPGMSKDWGFYLLTAWRYYFNDDFMGRIHLDYRERKDFASGFDAKYNTHMFGEGFLRTYYMNERSIILDKPWKESIKENFKEEIMNELFGADQEFEQLSRDTIERERFRVSLRHNWDVDDNTTVKLEYNRLSDSDFLKDYVLREHEIDASPSSYLLFTRLLPFSTFSVLGQKRTNRWVSETEKLPEVKLNMSNREIGESRLYYSGDMSFINFNYKQASPSDIDENLNRIDSYNKLSYPKKIAFIEVTPYVAGRMTYYDRDMDYDSDNALRGTFYTGLDLSTKFYRIFDITSDIFKLDINQLRHIITPSASYNYIHEPTIPSSKFYAFDSIDSIVKSNSASLSLENKLQTKRGGKKIDLLRFIMGSSYIFNLKPQGSRFGNINLDLEVMPYDWILFEADSIYDKDDRAFSTANFDLVLRGAKEENNYDQDEYKFFLGAGYRYDRDSRNQLTSQLTYRLNPEWKFRVYERWEQETGGLREQEYTIYKDLHCWQMGFTYRVRRDHGEEIFLVFKIKAFPETGFEFNKGYHAPKEGSFSY